MRSQPSSWESVDSLSASERHWCLEMGGRAEFEGGGGEGGGGGWTCSKLGLLSISRQASFC